MVFSIYDLSSLFCYPPPHYLLAFSAGLCAFNSAKGMGMLLLVTLDCALSVQFGFRNSHTHILVYDISANPDRY
uniref:Uncharacterized protein n=1 Tax=Rhizophora mucronata TaxID=61149 RepID=A0A2P2Q573_RHIMU